MIQPLRVLAATLAACALLPVATLAGPPNTQKLGQLHSRPGADYSDVWGFVHDDGTEYAILGYFFGTEIINVDDPANPYETGYFAGPGSYWRDIKTYGDYAYIVTEGSSGGMQIVDLSDPENPVLVKKWGSFTAHNLYIEEATARAYICGTDEPGTIIASLADPENPVELGTYNGSYVHDLHVRDDVAWLAEINAGTLSAFDFTQVNNPVRLSGPTSYTGSFTHNSWPSDDGTLLLTTDERSGARLRLWDISNPATPVELGNFKPAGSNAITHNGFFAGGRVVASWYTDGVRILDVQDPQTPIEVAYYDSYPYGGGGFHGAWGVYPYLPSGNILVGDIDSGLHIFSVLEPQISVVRGTVHDAQGGGPLAGIALDLSPGPTLTSSANGGWGQALDPGNYQVTLSAEGYLDSTFAFTLAPGDDITVDLAIRLQPLAMLTGVVRGGTPQGPQPLGGAAVELEGFAPPQATAGDGAFAFGPAPVQGGYTLRARRAGWGGTVRELAVEQGGTQLDLLLAPSPIYDTLDSAAGWQAGDPVNDNASSGQWVHAIPVPSGGGLVAPGVDGTPDDSGGWCFVTGNGADPGDPIDSADVDGGKTTLTSPVYDASGIDDPWVGYARWYVNEAGGSPGIDPFVAQLSGDGGTSWATLEVLSSDHTPWEHVAFRVSDHVVGDQLRLRFFAQDTGGVSVVEAGVDDIELWGTVPSSVDNPPAHRPSPVALGPAVPNPFNPATVLSMELAHAGFARLTLHDTRGRLVRQLLAQPLPAGRTTVRWDGRDDGGRPVAGGVYLARLVAPGGAAHQKLVLAK